MKAVVFDNGLRFVEDHPVPEPSEGEALIRVSMAGICNTDIEITRGYMGFKGIIGHEFVGVVEDVNGDEQGWAGKRVVGEINCGCGICEYCLKGLKNHCPFRKVIGILGRDGAMAEYLTLPLPNLFGVPEEVSDEEAVFVEPLAAAFEILEQVRIGPDHKVLVMGDGKLGLLVASVIRNVNRGVTLAGKHEGKMRIALQMGIKTIPVKELDIKGYYDIVVDATGSADALEMAMQLVRPRGTIVLKSTVAERKDMNLAPIVINEITLIGSRCGPFMPAINALQKGLIDVKPLITGIYPFSMAGDAFRTAMQGDSLKVIIDFGL
jgi:threonine dehydrogenase-like Zn-dependent dehydrogenase